MALKVKNTESGSLYTSDSQISAVQDDGTKEGVIRSKIVNGELVKLPANSIDYIVNVGGSAAVQPSQGVFSNSDGSGSAINLATVAGLGTNIASLTTTIYGRSIGVRFRRNAATPLFSVIVDGVAYDLPDNLRNWYTDNTPNPSIEREALWVLDDNLTEGAHTVKVILPSSDVANTLVLFGFLAESKSGYTEKARLDSPYSVNASVISTPSNITSTDSNGTLNKGVKYILYRNIDSANAHVITILWGSSVLWVQSIPPNSTYKFELSAVGFTVGSGSIAALMHSADSNGVIVSTVIGSL